MEINQAILQRLLIEQESGQVMDSSRFTTINDLSQDIHLLRQVSSVFASGNHMRSAFMSVVDDGPRISFRLQIFGVSGHLVDYAKNLEKEMVRGTEVEPVKQEWDPDPPPQVSRLLEDFSDCFVENKPLGVIHGAEHIIATTDEVPVTSRPYRTSWQEQGRLKDELDQLLKLELIRPSDGKWSSPVLFVSKKDGSLCFCVDFRKLNAKTVRDTYPFPQMERKSLLPK